MKEREYTSLRDYLDDLHALSENEFRQAHGEGFLVQTGIWVPAMAPSAAAVLLKGSANQDVPVSEPRVELDSRVYPIRHRRDAIFSFISVGRTVATDIVINDASVGKFHAVFNRKGGDFLLEDAKSTNGTYVNNKRAAVRSTGKAARLNNGDSVRFGAVETMFVEIGEFRALLQRLAGDALPQAATG